MEYGNLGHVKVDAPWTRIRSGHTEINLDDVHLVFTISTEETANPHISWLHQRKMACDLELLKHTYLLDILGQC